MENGSIISNENIDKSVKHLSIIALFGWLSILGFDFFLHAGLLATLYIKPNPFLLPPTEAFIRIPFGYLSILLLTVILLWLMVRLEISGWRKGSIFGLKFGCLISGVSTLGLISISTADIVLLIGWFFGQTLELGIAGAIMGSGLAGKRLTILLVIVLIFIVSSFMLTVILQTLGLAPTVRI